MALFEDVSPSARRSRARAWTRRPRMRGAWVFTNNRGREKVYTVNGAAHVFARALERAGITTGRRHAAHAALHGAQSHDRRGQRRLHRDVDLGALVDTRMLGRYTHPTTARKLEALSDVGDGQNVGQTGKFRRTLPGEHTSESG